MQIARTITQAILLIHRSLSISCCGVWTIFFNHLFSLRFYSFVRGHADGIHGINRRINEKRIIIKECCNVKVCVRLSVIKEKRRQLQRWGKLHGISSIIISVCVCSCVCAQEDSTTVRQCDSATEGASELSKVRARNRAGCWRSMSANRKYPKAANNSKTIKTNTNINNIKKQKQKNTIVHQLVF